MSNNNTLFNPYDYDKRDDQQTISSFEIDDKSSSGIGNNRRRGTSIGSSNKRQIRNSGLSQSDHNTSTHTTTIALLRRRINYLEESNSSILERVASLEKQVSFSLANEPTLEGEKSRIGTDSSIIDYSEASNNNNNNNNGNYTSDTILVIDDSTTGLLNNIEMKNKDRKEKKMSMTKKKHNTTTTNSNNHDNTKKREPRRSRNKTANNRRDTTGNGKTKGIGGSKSLSTDDGRRKSLLSVAAKSIRKLTRKSRKSL